MLVYQYVKFCCPTLCCPNFLLSEIPNLQQTGKEQQPRFSNQLLAFAIFTLYTFSHLSIKLAFYYIVERKLGLVLSVSSSDFRILLTKHFDF